MNIETKNRLNWVNVDGKGVPVSNLANVLLAFRTAPELIDIVAFDRTFNRTTMMKPLPGLHSRWWQGPRVVRDADISALQEWLQLAGLARVGRSTVVQAVDVRATECRVTLPEPKRPGGVSLASHGHVPAIPYGRSAL